MRVIILRGAGVIADPDGRRPGVATIATAGQVDVGWPSTIVIPRYIPVSYAIGDEIRRVL